MGNPFPNYQKLTGFSIRQSAAFEVSASRSRLYLGTDHLLLLEKTYFREAYRRFYFRDIQALVMHQTKDWLWYSLAWLGCSLVFGAITLAALNSGAFYFFMPLTVMCVLGLIINNAMGQTCNCRLRTAVQYEVLPGLHRVRQANKTLDRLRPLILAAQGPWETAPAEPANVPEPTAPAAEVSPAPKPDAHPESPPPPTT